MSSPSIIALPDTVQDAPQPDRHAIMGRTDSSTCLHEGKFLSLYRIGRWEFASRAVGRHAVGIVAITDQQDVVLVEQHRPPVGEVVIEIPAGLTGDVEGAEDESFLESAKRELLEETGYVARQWTQLLTGYSSPGLTDEAITIFLAEGLTRKHDGGGDHTEEITVHHVAFQEVLTWLEQRGAHADLKLLAGLMAAEAERAKRR